MSTTRYGRQVNPGPRDILSTTGGLPTSGGGGGIPPTVAPTDPTLAQWAQGAVDAMWRNVTRPDVRSAAMAISDPVQRLEYLLQRSPASSDQMPLYNAYLSAHPRPSNLQTPATTKPPEGPAPVDNSAALTLARQSAQSRLNRSLELRGLNPADFQEAINLELDKMGATYDKTSDPKGAYADDNSILDRVVTQSQERNRNMYTGQVDQSIGTNYGDKLIQSSLLDDTIASILNDQRGGAMDFLNRGLKRGIYNDVGYSAGLHTLDNEAAAARSRLNSLGGNVLDTYRTQANDVRDQAYNAASNFNFGRPFDLNRYTTMGQDILGRAQANAGGDLRGTLGGENLFDFGGLAQNVGNAQGAVNLRDADVATALAERKRRNSLGRGLGSQGGF